MQYILAPEDGVQEIQSDQHGDLYHDLSIYVEGSSPAGSLTLTAKKPGSSVFEAIPDGVFDLSSLNSIQFTGAVAVYQATIASLSGVDFIKMTDTNQGV